MSAGRPSLTVCCLAVEPPAQVAQVLQFFREIADEMIVAADARRGADELGPYFAVADRVLRYEYDTQPCHARPWLHSLCHGDWIFSIDGDEVPSVALTEALPELIARTDLLQYVFPRRWVYGDPTRWLEELPWWPDYHTRLVRTGPTMRHTGRIHEGFRPAFPLRHTDLPIYHLPFLTAGMDERRDRSARYEAVSPFRVAYGGGGLNETFNLPEVSARSSGSAVPEADVARIQLVLAQRERTPQPAPGGTRVPLITRAEIDRYVRPVALATDDYRGALSIYAELGRMAPGETRQVFVRVGNQGSVTWPWGFECEPFVRLGYHWVTADGSELPDEGRRSPLTSDLCPGDASIVPVDVQAPVRVGMYTLAIDLVHEGVRWFGAPAIVQVLVEADPTRPPPRPPLAMVVAMVVADHQRPQARVLAESFLRQHPHGRIVGLLVDASDEGGAEPFEILTPDDLPIDRVDLHRMAAMYDERTLALALKPFLLRHLLIGRGLPAVTYLDPDSDVLGVLDNLDLLARRHGIVVVPHRLGPQIAPDGRRPDERDLAMRGPFHLGYLGVGRAAEPFLAEWSNRCSSGGAIAEEDGRHDEQRTIGGLLAGYPHHVLHEPGCAVAYWNADQRPITAGPEGLRADGWPLRFIHFSGFDPAAPHLLSREMGDRPRILLSETPVLRDLAAGYTRRITAAAHEPGRRPSGRWERTAGGVPLDPIVRRILRDEARRRAADPRGPSASTELPDVFADGSHSALVALLASAPRQPERGTRGLPRLLEEIYRHRPDLRLAFPNVDVDADDRTALAQWLHEHGRVEYELPDALVAAVRSTIGDQTVGPPPGRVIIDEAPAGSRSGATARALRSVLADQLHEPCAPADEVRGGSTVAGAGDIRLLLLDDDRCPLAVDSGPRRAPEPYTIGILPWGVDEFSRCALPDVGIDEIWTYSRQAVAAIRREVAQPVRRLPATLIAHLAGPVGNPPEGNRPAGSPGRFVFLCRVDARLGLERQNAPGVVQAFQRAFSPAEGPVLIIECIGAASVDETEALHAATADRADIRVIGGFGHDAPAGPAYDCFVSLHRAEGMPVTMAQAMLAGLPVITTNYSGNLDFMTDENAFLVRCAVAPVPAGNGGLPTGALWAEPDLNDAARLMRLVHRDADVRERVASKARCDLVALHPPGSGAVLLAARLAEVRARASATAPDAPTSVTDRVGGAVVRTARRAVRQLLLRGAAGSAPSTMGGVEHPQPEVLHHRGGMP